RERRLFERHRRSGHRGFGLPRLRVRRPRRRRRRQRGRPHLPRTGPGGTEGPDRVGPELRARLSGRGGGHPLVPGGAVLMANHFPWLTVITFLPLIGAVPLAFFPARAHNLHRLWALLVTILTFALVLGMLAHF